MPEDKHQTFALTIRPKSGITDDDLELFKPWCNTRSKYFKIITEKDGDARHIHAFMVTHMPIATSNLRRSLLKLFEHWTPVERDVLRNGVKVAYNKGWLDYMDKGDSTVSILSDLPEKAHIDAFFPVKEPADNQKVRKHLNYYQRLKKLWWEHSTPGTEVNAGNCRDFLFKMMYKEELLDTIRDDKTIIQISRHLSRHLLKLEYSSIEVSEFENDK